MMRLVEIKIAACALLCFNSAHAEDRSAASELASTLSRVLAGEEICGLQYDQKAIARLIESKIKPDDAKFSQILYNVTWNSKRDLKDIGRSELTAFCTQTRRLAKSYGFID